MSNVTTAPPGDLTAPGATIAARLMYWQQKSWEELCALMTPADKCVRPPADRLHAPPVQVTATLQPDKE
jgi:hypothetical protein